MTGGSRGATYGAAGQTGRTVWDLDWNLLRTFLVIVEEGGITAAANRLRLKQPTVSSALRRLEDRLGKRLIERRPGRFEVTPAGKLLHGEAAEIFGHATLATASHVVSPVLDEVLSAFHQRHPKATHGATVPVC